VQSDQGRLSRVRRHRARRAPVGIGPTGSARRVLTPRVDHAQHTRADHRGGGLAMAEFSDRVVLVTGSSSGIGEQIARRFAALGASVVVNSSTSVAAGEQLAAELGERATYVQADIADADQARRLVDATVEHFGALDVLVNNAGWTTRVDHRDLDALTDEIFLKTFDVNVFGAGGLTKAAIPRLRQSADGNIVNITSIAG